MKRLNLFAGHFGSGKTEISINFAKKLRELDMENISLVDLDIVNPFFCSRELTKELGEEGIRVISSDPDLTNAELMVVSGEVLSAFNHKEHTVIFDIGGDDMGATALGQYHRFFQEEPYEMFFVINTTRPFTSNAQDVMNYLQSIEVASRLKVTKLINNANLSFETTPADIQRGQEIVKEVSEKTGLPIAFTAVRRDLVEEVRPFVEGEILPMDIYMKPPWR